MFQKKTDQQKQIAQVEKTVDSVLQDANTKKILTDTSVYLEEKFRSNWFTMEQVLSKTHFKELKPAIETMNLLCLTGFCYREEKAPGIIKYKITLNNEIRMELLKNEKVEAEAKVKHLESMIQQLAKVISNKK